MLEIIIVVVIIIIITVIINWELSPFSDGHDRIWLAQLGILFWLWGDENLPDGIWR